MTDDALVTLSDVAFSYGPGAFSLRVDTLQLARGERVACIGPSGAGKTTLVNLIAGILTPSTGTVTFDAAPLSALSDAQRRALRLARIGMVFQEFELLEYLTTRENVLLPFLLSRTLRADADALRRADALIDRMGIAHAAARTPRGLSQGERQRVAIARAMVTRPDLLLCDEPTGNLDPATADSALDLLVEQAQQRNCTVLMVTHNHALLSRFDRIINILDYAAPRQTAEAAP